MPSGRGQMNSIPLGGGVAENTQATDCPCLSWKRAKLFDHSMKATASGLTSNGNAFWPSPGNAGPVAPVTTINATLQDGVDIGDKINNATSQLPSGGEVYVEQKEQR